MAVCQNLVPLVNIKIAGKWMFIPLKIVLIGIDPYPYSYIDIPNAPVVFFLSAHGGCKHPRAWRNDEGLPLKASGLRSGKSA